MNLKVELTKNSAFNSEEHFFLCLNDLVNEWEETLGAKEMDEEDSGFNCERLRELRTMIEKEVSWLNI